LSSHVLGSADGLENLIGSFKGEFRGEDGLQAKYSTHDDLLMDSSEDCFDGSRRNQEVYRVVIGSESATPSRQEMEPVNHSENVSF
jgi:hypothetical protein